MATDTEAVKFPTIPTLTNYGTKQAHPMFSFYALTDRADSWQCGDPILSRLALAISKINKPKQKRVRYTPVSTLPASFSQLHGE